MGSLVQVTIALESVYRTDCSLQASAIHFRGSTASDSRPPSPRDGSASAPTKPRLVTPSTHSDQHVVGPALPQAITGAPTSHKIGSDRRVAPVNQGQDHSVDHAATVASYRAQARRLRLQDHCIANACITPVLPSTIKGEAGAVSRQARTHTHTRSHAHTGPQREKVRRTLA